MSANTPTANSSYALENSDVNQIVASFVEDTTQLAECLGVPEERVRDFRESAKALGELVEQTVEEATEAHESAHEANARADDLEEELREERETRSREAAQDRKRLSTVEEDLESVGEDVTDDETPTPQTSRDAFHEPQTPLEEIIQLPEHVAEKSLSANQKRSRFVAKDIHDYTRSVPAGRALKSSELRRVLSAGEEGTVYTQTVTRVIQFLDKLGGDSVEVNETRGGERVVVFDDTLVKRVVAFHNSSNAVVTGEGVTG